MTREEIIADKGCSMQKCPINALTFKSCNLSENECEYYTSNVTQEGLDWAYSIFNKDKIMAQKEKWTKEAEEAGMTLTEYIESINPLKSEVNMNKDNLPDEWLRPTPLPFIPPVYEDKKGNDIYCNGIQKGNIKLTIEIPENLYIRIKCAKSVLDLTGMDIVNAVMCVNRGSEITEEESK